MLTHNASLLIWPLILVYVKHKRKNTHTAYTHCFETVSQQSSKLPIKNMGIWRNLECIFFPHKEWSTVTTGYGTCVACTFLHNGHTHTSKSPHLIFTEDVQAQQKVKIRNSWVFKIVCLVTHTQGTYRQMTEWNVNLTQEIISCLEEGKQLQQINLRSSRPLACEDTKNFPGGWEREKKQFWGEMPKTPEGPGAFI